MKFYGLILKEYNKYPKVLYTCKEQKDAVKLVLKYYIDNGLAGIIKHKEFKPNELGAGRWLVADNKDNTEYLEYQVVNSGWVRDYFEFWKVNRLNIVEIDISNQPPEIKEDDLSPIKKLEREFSTEKKTEEKDVSV